MKKNFFLVLFTIFILCLDVYGQTDTAETKFAREKMVEIQLKSRDITDSKVLEAMLYVPRHLFTPEDVRHLAYNDYPLRIQAGQTISQPYIVALMTQSLELEGTEKVLEIGTGSGYQAAVLSEIVEEVFTIEIKQILYEKATETLGALGYDNVNTLSGDGYYGWPSDNTEFSGKFDCIMITAAVEHIPPPLLVQLKDGGKMVLPLGNPYSILGQTLVVVTKIGTDFEVRQIVGVSFVPMTGKALE